jgi:hypothetical protein
MDRHLIPFLQAAIDSRTNSFASVIIDLRVQEYSFSFRHIVDHCDVTVFFDPQSDCVCMNQVYIGDNDHDDNDDLSLKEFLKYILSSPK